MLEKYPLAQAKILVVDDDPMIRKMIEGMIKNTVAQITSAANGLEGLALWQSEQPDIVITDINMPALDGLSMSEKIYALDAEAEIIVLSSSNEVQDLIRAIEIGVSRYVIKPIESKLLVDAIRKGYANRQNAIELKLARMVFDVANEGILITDDQNKILAINPAFSEITGYRYDEVVGRHTRMLSSGLHDPEFYRSMWNSLGSLQRWSGEVTNRRKNGDTYVQWLSIASVSNDFGTQKHYVGLTSDISERKKEEELIRKLAHFDTLTGLPNRALFNDRVQREIASAKRRNQSLALIYVDLDHFKSINDIHGHAAGDLVLKTAAERMSACIRQSDMVSRRGGDEFVIMLDTTDGIEAAVVVCTKLVQQLAQPIQFEDKKISITASIGVAVAPLDAEDFDSLLQAADYALYEAKASGRNCYVFFSQDTMNQVNGRLAMETELRDGMKSWRYSIRYLPEISLKTGKVENLEALLRFNHPEFGLLDAGRFLELAEEIGIMPELGQRALAQAAQETSLLSTPHIETGLVVDLSARQLSAPNAADALLGTLDAAGVGRHRITFECTEKSLTGNEAAMKTLFKLAASGCKFTLDDFGVGYCSFSLLSQIPMTSIKIDRTFVAQLEHNAQYRQLVAALIAFAHRLGLKAIAEGVESEAQLAFLKESGCDAAQGYLFGKPMEFAVLKSFLESQKLIDSF